MPIKTIGVLFGVENSFPSALVEHINARNLGDVRAEFVLTGAVQLDSAQRYSVIIDRISHDVPFYRAFLKHAALNGVIVINDPFWSAADDKFFNYALAQRIGVAIPPTAILPHKQLPNQTTERSMRNLEFPLDWEAVFANVGEHGFLKPIDGGGWRDVREVRSREEFFRAYDESRDLCMAYQKAIDFDQYCRCYVVGQKKVHVMAYDPRRPHAERYLKEPPACGKKLLKRMEQDALKICRALGYEMNTVEFAVQDGVPYAIDFMNPVPDADVYSVGAANFEWIVRETADLAIARARKAPSSSDWRWSAFLDQQSQKKKAASKRKPAGIKKTGAATRRSKKHNEETKVRPALT